MARNPLPYRVESNAYRCGTFEPIAAFNVDFAAFRYAERCIAANPQFTYRVTLRGKVVTEHG